MKNLYPSKQARWYEMYWMYMGEIDLCLVDYRMVKRDDRRIPYAIAFICASNKIYSMRKFSFTPLQFLLLWGMIYLTDNFSLSFPPCLFIFFFLRRCGWELLLLGPTTYVYFQFLQTSHITPPTTPFVNLSYSQPPSPFIHTFEWYIFIVCRVI